MSLFSFIKKQFIDIRNGRRRATACWPGAIRWDNEIQYGASLTVRESQMAVFINEGRIADVFGPGMYTLTTQTLPVLTYLKTGTSCSSRPSSPTWCSSAPGCNWGAMGHAAACYAA
jgi:membrane protease subunit (stomatin/prohibitin family)